MLKMMKFDEKYAHIWPFLGREDRILSTFRLAFQLLLVLINKALKPKYIYRH